MIINQERLLIQLKLSGNKSPMCCKFYGSCVLYHSYVQNSFLCNHDIQERHLVEWNTFKQL